MGLFSKLFGKSEDNKRADIELRFERIRSAVAGTMSNFFVAKDRLNSRAAVLALPRTPRRAARPSATP